MSSNICLGEIQYLATHHVFRDREVQNILDAKSNPGFPYVFAGGKKNLTQDVTDFKIDSEA